MVSRNVERLGGLFIFLVSLIGYQYNLNLISTQHYWYPKAMSFASAFIILGLGLIIFPTYRRERLERGENIDNLQGLSLLTPKWWVILVISITAAVGNLIYFQFYYH